MVRSSSKHVPFAELHRQVLGGSIPASLDIYIPALSNTRVRIDIPKVELNGLEGWKSFTARRVLQLVYDSLAGHAEFDVMFGSEIQKSDMALAWRYDTNLDWVWGSNLEGREWMNGEKEDAWSVIWGFAMRRSENLTYQDGSFVPLRLEARLAEHQKSELLLSDGSRLKEPPSIEGFLWRIRPRTSISNAMTAGPPQVETTMAASSQTRSLTYITTHNGYMFTIPPSLAMKHLPEPPRAPDEALPVNVPSILRNGDAIHIVEDEQEREHKRGARLILDADAIFDIRNIISVRRAESVVPVFPSIPLSGSRQTDRSVDFEADNHEDLRRSRSDDEDEGGDNGLRIAADGERWRVRRRVELCMRSGFIIQLEVSEYLCFHIE